MKRGDRSGCGRARAREDSTHVLNLVFVESRNSVNDHVGQAATKVDDFMHQEGHDAGGESVILPPKVPSSPEALSNVEVNIDLGDLLENSVVVGRCRRVETGRYGGVEGGERRGSGRQLLDLCCFFGGRI